MDDFYDDNVEGQVSALLIMPSAILETMRIEFVRLGGPDGATQSMYKCGRAVGQAIAANIKLGDDQDLEEMLHLMWAEVGLGHLFVIDNEDGRLVIRVERLLEATIVGLEHPCDFTRGCLAGIIEAVAGKPYGGMENRVEDTPDTRIFIIAPL